MKKILIQINIILAFLFIGQSIKGQAGNYDVIGNLTFGTNHFFEIKILSNEGTGMGHDQISVTGDLTLNGVLNIVLDGYVVDDSDQFTILAYNGVQNGTFSEINWPPEMSHWLIDYGQLNNGYITIYGSELTVPVELISLKVENLESDNLITWQTASELNNDFFEIEHSNDGQKFVALDRVSSSGVGNQQNSYAYTHKSPSSGRHFYRLHQFDIDGKSSLSNVVSIFNETEKSVSYYPNPVENLLFFDTGVSFTIYDMNGNSVHTAKNKTKIDLSFLHRGSYILEFVNGNLDDKIIIKQ